MATQETVASNHVSKDASDSSTSNEEDVTPDSTSSSGWRFWAIFLALAITSLLAAVESTVTSTAMPVIAAALDAGELYVWFVNAYTLAR